MNINMRSGIIKILFLACLLFIAILLVPIPVFFAGCTSAPVQSVGPSIKIAHPNSGDTVYAGALQIIVDVSNFILVNKLGQSNVPGEGHIHYFLDIEAPTASGVPAIPASGIWAATPATSYIFEHTKGKSSASLVVTI
jgi:hypothetical protein